LSGADEFLAQPAGWEFDAVLADGGVVHVRPIRGDDEGRLVEFHSRLSSDTIYRRFFSPRPELSKVDVERFTRLDYRDRMALVALLDGDLVAVTRYDRRRDDPEIAEVAFVVRDDQQGRGISTLLLEHLAAYAREQGIRRFVAVTLPQNRPMMEVFRGAGFALETSFGEGEINVTFPIAPSDSSIAAMEERERKADALSIARILRPTSIAVVGAGRARRGIGHEIFRNLLRADFQGAAYPVNPNASSVAGVRAFESVTSIPDPVDLAVVAVPASHLLDAVKDCAAKGVGAAVIVSAGLAETGDAGAEVERELVGLARAHGMRLVGPNCIGVVNTADDVRMNATFAPARLVPGSVGLLSQSGALGIAALDYASRSGLGLSTFVSVGNKADVSGNDLLLYWEDDPATQVILLYLESFGNPRKFAHIARRVSHSKPIVAVKSGRTATGVGAARSHTAAAASPDVAVDALFLHTGVIRVDTVQELFELASVLACQPPPAGRRLAIVGNSGGPGILAADACEGAGLVVPTLSPDAQAALRRIAPSGAAVHNPVDLTAAAGPDQYRAALELLTRSPEVDALLVIFTPTLVASSEEVMAEVTRTTADSEKSIVASVLAGTSGGFTTDSASERRVPTFTFPEQGVRALGHAAAWSAWRARPKGVLPALEDVDPGRARRLVEASLPSPGEDGWLDAERAADLVASYGIAVAPTRMASQPDEAAAVADDLGYPVVLKAGGAGVVHKTDVGGVALDLSTAGQVREAFSAMSGRLGDTMQGAVIQPMVAPGVETIVGISSNDLFGPLIVFGVGGVLTDLLGDHAVRMPPLTDLDASQMLRSIRAAPLLFGYRGSPPVNTAALENLLLRVGRLAVEVPEIAEMDLNPVIASPDACVAVDVKIRLAPPARVPDPTLRRLR
jgi:acetyl coenzyme A synthetase (ADP forming)-like protein